MKLIKKLGTRLSESGHLVSWGLYQCPNPICNKQVERPLSDGKKCKSCGCQQGNRIHNESRTKLYRVWIAMKQRILNPNCEAYKDYGGRGITICQEWANSYIKFRDWALENGYADKLTLDRIFNDNDYEPSNCQWIPNKENAQKTRRTILTLKLVNEIRDLWNMGIYTIKELAEIYSINKNYIGKLIRNERWRNDA